MATYKELVYMVLDEAKARSDDFYYTEDHILFLLDKYRAFLLKLKYSDIKKQIPLSNYQKIKVKSNMEIPSVMNLSTPFLEDSGGTIYNFCSWKRFKFVHFNSYLANCKYFTIENNYITNPGTLYSAKINIKPDNDDSVQFYLTAVFEQPSKAHDYNDNSKNIFDWNFPLEESLISPMIEMTVKDLVSAVLRPEDNNNNGKDDLGNMNRFMANNVKSDLAKQLYG